MFNLEFCFPLSFQPLLCAAQTLSALTDPLLMLVLFFIWHRPADMDQETKMLCVKLVQIPIFFYLYKSFLFRYCKSFMRRGGGKNNIETLFIKICPNRWLLALMITSNLKDGFNILRCRWQENLNSSLKINWFSHSLLNVTLKWFVCGGDTCVGLSFTQLQLT